MNGAIEEWGKTPYQAAAPLAVGREREREGIVIRESSSVIP